MQSRQIPTRERRWRQVDRTLRDPCGQKMFGQTALTSFHLKMIHFNTVPSVISNERFLFRLKA